VSGGTQHSALSTGFLRKLYAVLPDEFGEQHDMIRVIDESGDDYLYPNSYFVRVELPRSVQ
jgi:hypothetical protein